MLDELSSRNVKCMNFYGICSRLHPDRLCLRIWNLLEQCLGCDEEQMALQQFKESAPAVVSVPGQEEAAAVPQRVKARFYNVSEILTPTLAWASWARRGVVAMVNEFKEQVLGSKGHSASMADYNTVESFSLSDESGAGEAGDQPRGSWAAVTLAPETLESDQSEASDELLTNQRPVMSHS